MGVLVICVLVLTVFCIVCTVFLYCVFMNIYSYLFCLWYCKDYSHRVTNQLQLVTIIQIIIIIILLNLTLTNEASNGGSRVETVALILLVDKFDWHSEE